MTTSTSPPRDQPRRGYNDGASPPPPLTPTPTSTSTSTPTSTPTPTFTTTSTPARRKPVDKQSLDYILRSGLAGGLAGCAAKTAVAPLDRVKILFQASSPQFARYSGSFHGLYSAVLSIYATDGPRGLFRGHSATLLRIFPYAAIKFLAYEQIRHVAIPDARHETPWRRLVSGSLAGVTSVFFTYPLEVIRVRLAFETKAQSRSSGLAEICRTIYRERPRLPKGATAAVATPRSGLANFYRGFAPTLFGMLPYAGFSFLTHDTAGDLLRDERVAKWTTVEAEGGREGRGRQLKYWAELLTGATAGLVSQTASYPLEVVRRRMQVGGAVGDGHRLAMRETVGLVYKERGMRGFFVGLGIGYLKVVPMVAVSFLVYEKMKVALGI